MAHWAEVDENNIVIQVVVGDNDDPAGDEGYQWLIDNLGGTWIQTSYNGNIRKNFAGIGYIYDADKDAFIKPKPYPSWVLDADLNWQAPIEMPVEKGKAFAWSETNQEWIEVKIATNPTI
jgi:hypothetical protein